MRQSTSSHGGIGDSVGPIERSFRKRNVQTVATHEDKLRVMTWMLAEEQALLEDGEDGLKKLEKVTRGDRMCLATRAISQFPELFRGSAQANYMKASRWWKDSKEYIYETSGMSGTKKARTGRGRKTSAWTTWLQAELKVMIDIETNVTWTSKDLLTLAKSIVDNSTHPEFNKDYIIPQRNCPISDLLNLRWIQIFKDKYEINSGRATELTDAKEAELLHHLSSIRDLKGGVSIGKKEVLSMANQLNRDSHPSVKMDSTWYKNFYDRHPGLNIDPPSIPIASCVSMKDNSLNGMQRILPYHAHLVATAQRTQHVDNAASTIDEFKTSELFQAIAQDQFNLVKSLMIRGVSTEGCNESGCTALVVATKSGQYSMVKVLLEFGAKTEAKDGNGHTPLVIATTSSQFHITKCLLESRANIEATNEQSKTPLILAAQHGDMKLVKLLIRLGAFLEARDEDDNTPALAAAKAGHASVVGFLVKKGADINAQDIDGIILGELMKTWNLKREDNVLI